MIYVFTYKTCLTQYHKLHSKQGHTWRRGWGLQFYVQPETKIEEKKLLVLCQKVKLGDEGPKMHVISISELQINALNIKFTSS